MCSTTGGQIIRQVRFDAPTRRAANDVPGSMANAKRTTPLLRTLDRAVGPLALGALGAWKRLGRSSRRPPSNPSSIGLLKTAAIGDTVLMSGVIADLRAAFPRAALIPFFGPSNVELAPLIPGLEPAVLVDVRSPRRAMAQVRSQPVDILIDFGSWPRIDAIMAALARAAWTIGFRCPGQRRHYAYDRVALHRGGVHEIENYRELARSLGVASASPPALKALEASPPQPLPPRYVVFHPCSGGRRRELKQWPDERWAELAGRVRRAGFEVVLTGSPADRAQIDAIIASDQSTRVLNLSGDLSLAQTATVLTRAAAVVGVSTGIPHIAAALGRPTIALEGATDPARWAPLGPRVWVIDVPPPAGGYISLGFEKPRPALGQRADAMSLIPAAAVWDRLESILTASPRAAYSSSGV